MRRVAKCACEKLRITVEGDPILAAVCNCTVCQRKTGSPYGFSSYFENSQLVSIEGEHRFWSREAETGRRVEQHFCANCGSNMFWYAEVLPDTIGIAAGNFNDPDFPVPDTAAWAQSKYKWVEFPPDTEVLPKSRF